MTRFKELFAALAVVAIGIIVGGSGTPDAGLGDQLVVGMNSDLNGGGSGGEVTWDTLTYVFTMDAAMDHFFASYDAAVAAADSVIELDSESSFAWAMLDANEINQLPLTLDDQAYYRMSFQDSTYGDWDNSKSGGRHLLIHFPFEDYIPANSQIVSAAMHAYNEGNVGWSQQDTVTATLMNTGDNLWYANKGYAGYTPAWANYAHCTWAWQESAAFGGSNVAWATAPGDKGWFWEWGDYSDLTGNNASTVADGADKAITLTNCIQSAVNGQTNNGIVIQINKYGAEAIIRMVCFDAPTTLSLDLKRPWIEVKFLTRSYAKPFGTADYAFVFSTDDGRIFNKNMSDTFAVRGVAYSMFIPDLNGVDDGDTDYLSPSKVMYCYENGVEIGSHGVLQIPVLGLNNWDVHGVVAAGGYWLGMYPTTPTAGANGPDSLYYDADPQHLYHLAASQGYPDSLKASGRFGKSYALSNNQWSPEVVAALVDLGYGAMRCQVVNGNTVLDANGNYINFAAATRRPARADTAAIGFQAAYPRRWRNMIGVPFTFTPPALLGVVGDSASVDMDVVAHKMHHRIEMARASGRRVLSTYCHAHRADPTYASSNDGGIDPDQMGVILDVVLARAGRGGVAGRVMTVGEYAAWMKASSTAIDTPTGWNAAADDSFAYTAAQEVWYKPDGIDYKPVRGLK